MKKIRIPAIALIAAIGFSACTKDKGETVIETGSNGVGTVSISFDRSAPAVASSTRGDEGNSKTGTEQPASNVESEVNMIEFFAFDKAGKPAGEGAYFRKNANSVAGATTILVSEGDMTFLVAVNADMFDNVDAYVASQGDKTYNGIKAFIASRSMDSANSQQEPAAGEGFVMTSEALATVVAGETNNLTMRLDRLLSKIMAPVVNASGADVAALKSDAAALDELFGTDIKKGDIVDNLAWKCDGYVVINGISNSYVFRYAGWNGWTAQTGWNWNKATYENNGADLLSAYAVGATADLFIAPDNDKPVYIYENRPSRSQEASGAAVVFEQDQVTAFLIKGHFTADIAPGGGSLANKESDDRYWRVNLLKTDAWEIFRNSVYRITVNSVNTTGFDTPQGAEEDGPVVDPSESSISISLVINDWDIRVEGVDL